MTKRFLILLIFSALVLTIGALFLFFRNKPEAISPKTPGPISTVFPTTPFSIPKWGARRQIDNSSAEEIRKFFSNQLSNKDLSAGETNIQAIYFNDADEKLISLNAIQPALDFSIQPDILGVIDKNDYEIFHCSKETHMDMGIIFYLSAPTDGSNLPDSAYRDAEGYMRKWEPYMFKDLHSILFPNTSFSMEELEKSLLFKDGKYRYAEIPLKDSSVGSINYAIKGSPIIISTSVQCLKNAENYFFDVEE